MKKINLLASLIFSFFLVACSNEGYIPSIELTAPNGDKIAESIEDVKLEISNYIAIEYGKDLAYTVTGVDYVAINDGFLAIINYMLEDGSKHNIVKTNNLNVLSNSSIDILIDNRVGDHILLEDDGKATLNFASRSVKPSVSFVCKSELNCTPCKVIAKSVGESTEVTCTTDCEDCKLKAIINP